jgi:hypothetical protein
MLGIAVAVHLHFQYPFLASTSQDWDALHLYQPLARGLLARGPAYFADPESVMAPPFAYAWHALFGASLDAVRRANLVLSVLTLLLLFRSAWLMHSLLAGVVAAFIYALCPLLKEFLVAPVTEGPFIFLCACWFWAMCEWFRGGPRAFIAVAGVALTLAVLTRAALVYWIVLAIAAFAVLALRRQDEARRRARGALVAHAIAAIAPAAFTAKNAAVFGMAFIATGAGNALYQGNHPVTRGYDGPFMNMVVDLMLITREPYHLTVESEKRLMTVAKRMIRDSDPVALAKLHAEKLGAFVFVTNAYPYAPQLRAARVALLLLAALGLVAARDAWMRWLLAAFLAYQVASYIPVLYTHRYSVPIDPWLMIAAAAGVAAVLQRRRPLEIVAAGAIVLAGAALGRYSAAHTDAPEPDVFAAARFLDWRGAPRRVVFDSDNPVIEVAVHDAPLLSPINVPAIVLEAALTPPQSRPDCGEVRFAYRRDKDGAGGETLVRRLEADGRVHRHQFGTLSLGLSGEGTLRMQVMCGKGATLDIRRIAIYTPVAAFVYGERYLGLEPPVRLPIEE